MICTFFGHRNAPEQAEPILRSVLTDLVEHHKVDLFYVGNHGGFDAMVKRNLALLRQIYPHIRYAVVLAYMPGKKDAFSPADHAETIFPEGLEKIPRKYAIAKRNEWMLARADFVVTYVTTPIRSGAAKFKELACKKGKRVIELAERAGSS